MFSFLDLHNCGVDKFDEKAGDFNSKDGVLRSHLRGFFCVIYKKGHFHFQFVGKYSISFQVNIQAILSKYACELHESFSIN